MGWLISISLTVVGLIKQDSLMLVAGGIFSISGCLGVLFSRIRNIGVEELEEEDQ